MRVDCDQCGQVINIPPDKVPDRAFSFACPACQARIAVEPPSPSPAVTEAPSIAAASVPEAAPAAASPTPTAPQADLAPPPLKGHERQLLAGLAPVAFVVELGCATDPGLDADLQAMGMQEVHRFQDLEVAVKQLLEMEIGILVIAVPKAAAPPFEPLQPLATIPARMRRRIFAVLTASNVTSLDGQVAFFLQVNCLINSNETGRRRSHLQRALLHHLKLYQHWTMDPA